jgi:hypothetical protein
MTTESRLMARLVRIKDFLRRRPIHGPTAIGRRRAIKLSFLSLILAKLDSGDSVAANLVREPAPREKTPGPDSRSAPPGRPGTTVLRVNSPTAKTNVAFGDSSGGIFTPIAWVFPRGAVTGGMTVAEQPRMHVVQLAKCNDGSLKHSAVVGVWSPTAGVNLIKLQMGTRATGVHAPATVPVDVVTTRPRNA